MSDEDYAFTAYNPNSHFGEQRGLTKREWFAGMALQAIIQGAMSGDSHISVQTEDGVLIVPLRKAAPALAYEYADAMLQQGETNGRD